MTEQTAFSRVRNRRPKAGTTRPESASQQVARERLERRRKKSIRRQRKIMKLIARRSQHLQSVRQQKDEPSWVKQKLQKVKTWWRKSVNS